MTERPSHSEGEPKRERKAYMTDPFKPDSSKPPTPIDIDSGLPDKNIDEEIDLARQKADMLASIGREDMEEAKEVALDSMPEKPSWNERRKMKVYKKPAGKMGFWGADAAHTGVRMYERMGRMAKRVGYTLSGFFTGLEAWGQKKLAKSKWVKYIPFLGKWLTAKPEKTWEERDKEEEKKALAAKKSAKSKKASEKKLTDSGLTKEQAKALLAVQEANKDEEKKDDKKDDEPKEEKKAA